MSRNTNRQLLRLLDGELAEWLPILAGIVIAIFLIWAIVRFRTWYQDDDDPEAADQQLLARLSELQREGDLTGEEYRSIKGQIIDRMERTKDAHDADSSDATFVSEHKNAIDDSDDAGQHSTHST